MINIVLISVTLFTVIVASFYFWLLYRIIKKAGYSGWWTITAFIPLLNIFMIWILAFADWPALNKSEEIKKAFE